MSYMRTSCIIEDRMTNSNMRPVGQPHRLTSLIPGERFNRHRYDINIAGSPQEPGRSLNTKAVAMAILARVSENKYISHLSVHAGMGRMQRVRIGMACLDPRLWTRTRCAAWCRRLFIASSTTNYGPHRKQAQAL